MNAFEFKAALNIGKFKKTTNDAGAPLLADYSIVVGGEKYYFCNNSEMGGTGAYKWCLITEDGTETYCPAESRKQVLADLLTSLYLNYKFNL